MVLDQELRIIKPEDLVFIDEFAGMHPIKVDLVYSQAEHKDNIFIPTLYKADARMLMHKELLPIVLDAAEHCFKERKLLLELKDCLRPLEAQEAMYVTDIVKANPHWVEEGPRKMLSSPGRGGHPRGMAVDIILIDENGDEIDMGTSFDYLGEDLENNPAARNYTKFSDDQSYNEMILDNRKFLTDAMLQAGKKFGREVWPLSNEWWDFRFLSDYTELFAPISDKDLPPEMRMTKD